ncbi:hypothetical protein Bpfe_014759 [Biomphalaria pfeifferi]|uniref:Uncharacterized protein n=1 Tax=Biomphalaria pfeifferi TaxID=112525 RepID=A0AAD8BLQ6_BIOPF|nr:hypothetical protein Bpfe_014759 [Biomphalaria pfeifferi]
MLNKVDKSVLQVEGQIDQRDKIVSQAKGGINLLGKEHLPGQDCGYTNSGDGGAGNFSAVTVLWASLAEMAFRARNMTTIAAAISMRYTELEEKKQMKKQENENDLNDGELIPAKPDVVVDEHYKDASWAYITDEAENDYVLETMATRGPTTMSGDVHGKGPLTQRLRTTTLESTVIATTSFCVRWLSTLTSTFYPCQLAGISDYRHEVEAEITISSQA